jgi:hypothetical protein
MITLLSVSCAQVESAIGAVEDVSGLSAVEGDFSVLLCYSGRAMYGARCVAISAPHEGIHALAALFLLELVEAADAVAYRGLLGDLIAHGCWRSDDVGLDGIVYWPGVEVEGVEPDDDLP